MKETEIENLYSTMLEDLEKINGSLRESILHLEDSLLCINKALQLLKESIREMPFQEDEPEIYFFKYTKPRFASWKTYVLAVHQIVSLSPVGTDQMVHDYYVSELDLINRFFHTHAFYYQYYLLGETTKDDAFFLRSNCSPFPLGGELLSRDIEFSTELDFLFAKFQGLERIRDFLIKRIELLHQDSDKSFYMQLVNKRKRAWSGDKVELVEMAYGLYYTQRINEGQADISDIIGWLEESLNIDLAQAYRMFMDISRRKTVSYTKYLDEMRNVIHEKIAESSKYKPKKS